MSHPQQREFCDSVRRQFPEMFRDVHAADFGSLDVNGNNRWLFTFEKGGSYTGIDIAPGPNVDVVCQAKDYSPRFPLDTVISTEMLEHDSTYVESLLRMYDCLRPGGLMVVTCASPGRPEHGTRRSEPASSPFTNDYYRNISSADLLRVIGQEQWEDIHISTDRSCHDLRFWGIKK